MRLLLIFLFLSEDTVDQLEMDQFWPWGHILPTYGCNRQEVYRSLWLHRNVECVSVMIFSEEGNIKFCTAGFRNLDDMLLDFCPFFANLIKVISISSKKKIKK